MQKVPPKTFLGKLCASTRKFENLSTLKVIYDDFWMIFWDLEFLKLVAFLWSYALRNLVLDAPRFISNNFGELWIFSRFFENLTFFYIIFGTFRQQLSSHRILWSWTSYFLKLEGISSIIVLQFCLRIPWCPERSIWSWKITLFRWNLDFTLRAPPRRWLRECFTPHQNDIL